MESRKDPEVEKYAQGLQKRWRFPSFSVHKITVSGSQGDTVIPHQAKAALSLRLVPNQDPAIIEEKLIEMITSNFQALDCDCTLEVVLL